MRRRRQPTERDLTWFLDLHKRGLLNLNPSYQRRSVWSLKERRYFLDTIFQDFPSPPVYLHKTMDEDGIATFHVVDGKQRLESIFLFTENKIALAKHLSDVTLAGRKWRQVSLEMKRMFWNYEIAVEFVDNVERSVVEEIFARINQTHKNLNRQELRHAKNDGWFITTAEDEAEKKEWGDLGISTTGRARRMVDVQFISELILVVIEDQIIGFSQDVLDAKYVLYDNLEESGLILSEELFKENLERVKKLLRDLENQNGCVTEYAKTFTNFYTLWSLVVLNHERLPEVDQLAESYSDFMKWVKVLSESKVPEELLAGDDSKLYRLPYRYYQNSRGASTDLSQRKERMDTLTEALLEDS